VCCSVLQCVAVCCSVEEHDSCVTSLSQCVAVCCRVLQCVVVCCRDILARNKTPFEPFLSRVLDCIKRVIFAFSTSKNSFSRISVFRLQHSCRRDAQCVAVCCSVLQCVAVCCSVLQCVAVCCSVLRLQHSCRRDAGKNTTYSSLEKKIAFYIRVPK